jgi:hypothetical protein
MSSQLSMFGPEPVVELVAAEDPPAMFWPEIEAEPEASPVDEIPPDRPIDSAAVLFRRWCRGAWLNDAEMRVLKESEFGRPFVKGESHK